MPRASVRAKPDGGVPDAPAAAGPARQVVTAMAAASDPRLPVRPPSALHVAFALIALYAAILWAYRSSFDVPFQFDDIDQIVENPAVQSPSPEALLRWAKVRILPFVTFALNAHFNGPDTRAYHAVNLVVHLLATSAVFALAFALCRTPRLRATAAGRHALPAAFATALLFGLHPIQTQSVTYIVQRTTAMAGLFYLAATWLFVIARSSASAPVPNRRRARAAYAGTLVSAVAAFLCKENAITLPVMLLVTDRVFFAAPWRAALRRLAPFALLVALAPALFLLLGRPVVAPSVAATLGPVRSGQILVEQWLQPAHGITPVDYLLTQATVVPRYLGLIAVPRGLNVDHDVPVARALSPAALAGFAAIAGLLVVASAALRRWPLVGYGLAWFLVTLSVESTLVPLPDVMVEHRLYLPMAGLGLAFGALFAAGYTRWPLRAALAIALLGAALAIATSARNNVWGSPLALWQNALEQSPDKPRVIQNVGVILFQSGQVDEAIAHYCRALKVDPDFAMARSNLNVALDQRLEAQMEQGDFSAVEIQEGANGVRFVVPKDPCQR
jgi:hypothetical protein